MRHLSLNHVVRWRHGMTAPSSKGLQTLLSATEHYCKTWDIMLNPKKTQNMLFGKSHFQPHLDGKDIEWVERWSCFEISHDIQLLHRRESKVFLSLCKQHSKDWRPLMRDCNAPVTRIPLSIHYNLCNRRYRGCKSWRTQKASGCLQRPLSKTLQLPHVGVSDGLTTRSMSINMGRASW